MSKLLAGLGILSLLLLAGTPEPCSFSRADIVCELHV